jgi:membrane-bound lytic murein transglycosylase MltF
MNVQHIWISRSTLCLAALLAVQAVVPSVRAQTAETKTIAPPLHNPAKMGDFDELMERRKIRVLVPYSRTLYFSDKGHERGLTAEIVRDFEAYLNRKYRKKLHNRPITIILTPTRRDELIPRLQQGFGDIAAGNLTATPERLAQVDFFAPEDMRDVCEVVLTSQKTGAVANVDALSGKTVYVRASSSYFASIQDLNRRFTAEKKPLVNVVFLDEALEDEDIMEMVDAGVIGATVVDDWKANMWAKILPGVVVNTTAAVRSGAHVGWAIRKNSPLLLAEVGAYYKSQKKTGAINYRFTQYQKKAKRLRDPTGRADWKHFQDTVALFDKYGAQYGFDPLMLAALGFQESRLDQNARSHVGAVGVMQLMPATGASMKVGDITVIEPNIHGGTKYMNEIMTKYFKDATFDEMNRTLFAFASYNAGPNRIAKLRTVAAQRGLDPNVWFDNVEIVVSEKVGRETTTYVRNILKYYVSYKLTMERQREQERALQQMKSGQ